jgi:hypothetical protein
MQRIRLFALQNSLFVLAVTARRPVSAYIRSSTDALRIHTQERPMTKFITSVATLVVIASLTGPALAKEMMPNAEKHIAALRNNCVRDYMSHCLGVNPNGSAAFFCLRKNVNSLSSGCQNAVRAVPTPRGQI